MADLSIEVFEEIYALRKGIESLAVKRSVIKLSIEKLKILRSMCESLIRAAVNKDLSKYLKDE